MKRKACVHFATLWLVSWQFFGWFSLFDVVFIMLLGKYEALSKFPVLNFEKSSIVGKGKNSYESSRILKNSGGLIRNFGRKCRRSSTCIHSPLQRPLPSPSKSDEHSLVKGCRYSSDPGHLVGSVYYKLAVRTEQKSYSFEACSSYYQDIRQPSHSCCRGQSRSLQRALDRYSHYPEKHSRL